MLEMPIFGHKIHHFLSAFACFWGLLSSVFRGIHYIFDFFVCFCSVFVDIFVGYLYFCTY